MPEAPNTATDTDSPVTPVVQFGTSRFLQAHVDLFIDEALARGRAAGPVTVVQSSGDPARAARLAALADPAGYPVRIRGRENGAEVDRQQMVRSVRRTLSTATDWPQLVRIVCDQARYLISNTGDAGYDPRPADAADSFDQAMSFPAKLQLLLRARHDAGARPLTVMPAELIPANGARLKARVLELAALAPAAYRDWLRDRVIWANSLVDRIVSEPLHPAGAVAEPYALWAIEAQPGLVPPCEHPCVQLVDDLERAEALKLFILNLGHSWLVSRWQATPGAPALVRQFLDDPAVLAELQHLYRAEVLPAFAAAGLGAAAEDYIATTLDRIRNPFLDHRLADIAENHAEKVRRRVGGLLDWAQKKGDATPRPRLAALAAAAAG
ncbi:mannitol dehydrogenase family protein [Halovulum marinum]|uniref:mannitol dehydrogenase family protein n=1 Tax=Halovulum marinum TaxID=2662447 RepID=UPI001F3D35A9|nr:mannitol dehydrogenase family protein [Halovulum marinum]